MLSSTNEGFQSLSISEDKDLQQAGSKQQANTRLASFGIVGAKFWNSLGGKQICWVKYDVIICHNQSHFVNEEGSCRCTRTNEVAATYQICTYLQHGIAATKYSSMRVRVSSI